MTRSRTIIALLVSLALIHYGQCIGPEQRPRRDQKRGLRNDMEAASSGPGTPAQSDLPPPGILSGPSNGAASLNSDLRNDVRNKTSAPSFAPTESQAPSPSPAPSKNPTSSKLDLHNDIRKRTPAPSSVPTESPAPSPSPSSSPSKLPTISAFPSISPSLSVSPTKVPSASPTSEHSINPTESPRPSPSPSDVPSRMPSDSPSTRPSSAPSLSMMPSAAPSVSSVPSHTPSFMPSIDTIVMSTILNVTLPTVTTPMDTELFEEIALQFIVDNMPPDSQVNVDVSSVHVTTYQWETIARSSKNNTSTGGNATIFFEVTSVVGPRPLPEDFSYPEHVGYGFQNNFEEFLALWNNGEGTSDKNGVFGGSDSGGSGNESEELRNDILIGVFVALLILLCLLFCCCFFMAERRRRREEATNIALADSMGDVKWDMSEDAGENVDPSTWDWDELARGELTLEAVINPTKISRVTDAAMCNVHNCRSALCVACEIEKRDQVKFMPVSPRRTRSWSQRLTNYLMTTPTKRKTRKKNGY